MKCDQEQGNFTDEDHLRLLGGSALGTIALATSPGFESELERQAADDVLKAIRTLPKERQMPFVNERINELRTGIDQKILADISGRFGLDGLSNEEKLAVIASHRKSVIVRERSVRSELRLLDDEKAVLQRKVDAWTEIEVSASVLPVAFSKPTSSRYHELVAEIAAGNVIVPNGEDVTFVTRLKLEQMQVFLVEHNWHSAFENATDYQEGEIHLPYPETCFEFDIHKMRICALFFEEHGSLSSSLFFQTGAGWAFCSVDAETAGQIAGPIGLAVGQQVRAICIALDADVAEAEVIRAPYRLNRAREKRGELPIYDHHVIALSRRAKPSPMSSGSEERTKRSPRLHFRRGHWRNYEKHKTWIKWTLVGDPDLGYIEKHYRI